MVWRTEKNHRCLFLSGTYEELGKFADFLVYILTLSMYNASTTK